jgi:hypothetical protein
MSLVNAWFSPHLSPDGPHLSPIASQPAEIKQQMCPELIELIEQEGATRFLVKIWGDFGARGTVSINFSHAAPPLQVARHQNCLDGKQRPVPQSSLHPSPAPRAAHSAFLKALLCLRVPFTPLRLLERLTARFWDVF